MEKTNIPIFILLTIEGVTKAKSANVILFEKELPRNMHLADESTIKTISFHPNGNLNNFGNLLFETERGEKRITLYIGRGVINYEK